MVGRASENMLLVSHWQKITSNPSRDPIALVLLGAGVIFAVCVSASMLSDLDGWSAASAAGLLLFYAVIGAYLGLVWRMLRTGLYVSDAGVRVLTTFRTTTVPWQEVAEVETVQGVELGVPKEIIRLRLANGEQLDTPVQRNVRPPGQRSGGGSAPDQFDQVAGVLREHVDRGASG